MFINLNKKCYKCDKYDFIPYMEIVNDKLDCEKCADEEKGRDE